MRRGERGPALLLAVTVALPLMAAVVLARGAPPATRATDSDAFQRLVGGLGLGTAVDLSGCAPLFDPRDGGACSFRHDPLPCGSFFCPAHSGG